MQTILRESLGISAEEERTVQLYNILFNVHYKSCYWIFKRRIFPDSSPLEMNLYSVENLKRISGDLGGRRNRTMQLDNILFNVHYESCYWIFKAKNL